MPALITSVAVLAFVLGTLTTSSQTPYQKVVHNIDPSAKCLDGSPGFLYVHEGGDLSKIMIFFLGGGICAQDTLEGTLESCYQRSKEYLGSSLLWPAELPSDLAQGYLSTDPSKNSFATWTKIFLPYCDGSLHQGYAEQPIQYKDSSLYFRGSAITRSHLQWIESRYGLRVAEKIVLTGMSAGGVAVNLWSNYVKSLVPQPDKVYPISDSGVFLNFPTYYGDRKFEKQMQNLYKIANSAESTPMRECNERNPLEPWRCFFIEHGFEFLRGRFLVINSEYDSWSIPNILRIKCLSNGTSGFTLASCTFDQLQQIEQYRTFYKQTLAGFRAANPALSIWSIACSNHVYAFFDQFYNSPSQRIPAVTGRTVKDVVEEYVLAEHQVIRQDAHGWPSNSGCGY